MRARVAAKPCRRQRQHRAQPLAPRLDQMGRDLGDARRVFRGHAVPDQRVDRRHILGKEGRKTVVGFM